MPTAPANGTSLYYEVHGKGQPLVLIQGLAGNHSAWFLQTSFFKKRYKVIVFDNRGIGKSSTVKNGSFSIKTMADDLAGLMDHLDIDKAHILGVSLGGMVAQEFAISHPERVKKLILCSTSPCMVADKLPPGLAEPNDISREIVATSTEGTADIKKAMAIIVSAAFSKRFFKILSTPLNWFSSRMTIPKPYLNQLQAVQEFNCLDRLHMIEAPTLVLTGTEDKIISPAMSDLLAEEIPNTSLVKLKGGSHTLFIEMKNRFNKEVLKFLTSF